MVDSFLKVGAQVVAVDRNRTKLDELAGVANVTSVPADISLDSDVTHIFEVAGVVDVLCNNAGITDSLAFVGDMSYDEWQRVLKTNLDGAFLMCHAAIPGMVENGGGVITNTSSLSGLRGHFSGPAYAAAKFGLVGLTYNIAGTYGPDGIRCNTICPGVTTTSIGADVEMDPRGMADLESQRFKEHYWLAPAEVAAVALFLATDAASGINGAAIPVDRGLMTR